ncbi:MAG: argininosuccinate lyase [Coriobacteriales bacterium]|jgi:argininosuccinate lyase|nr:argininosuccinate lyase [Coriobacteriales bacterium]
MTDAKKTTSKPTGDGATKPLWAGRFVQGVTEDMQVFGASLPVDIRLWAADIAGSKAHAHMLESVGIISVEDNAVIQTGLDAIAAELKAGTLNFDVSVEDIHMAIEAELIRRIGSAGGRLHTARSRNDQVATDFRLYCKQAACDLKSNIKELRRVIHEQASRHRDVIMPGYTHLQKAQPILYAQHLLAWDAMLARDSRRLTHAHEAADASPLGAAALAGTSYAIDRKQTADELGFATVISNSLDAVSDRDFACDLLYACATVMLHLSRICEELILWSSEEFGFITLADSYSTGSSIMPQKKNPDFAELTRGRSGRVFADLMALFITLKALPLAYNKDMQEDKQGTFDAVDTTQACLAAAAGMVSTMQVNAARMFEAAQGGYLTATDLADWLVGRGLPFRQAHEIVGKTVLLAQECGLRLDELSLEQLQKVSAVFTADALRVLDVQNAVEARASYGGTAPASVKQQLDAQAAALESD